MSHIRSQIIMLYTLNFYSDVCQLCLNKTGDGANKLPKKEFRLKKIAISHMISILG